MSDVLFEIPLVGAINGWAIVEILFLAGLAYAFIRHLQTTRGGGLIAGFSVIAIAFMIFVAIAIETLTIPHIQWLATKALPALMFGFIIVFQQEIRLGITRLGRIGFVRMLERFFGGEAPRQLERTAIAISKACQRMSKKRIGALIVVQRRDGIEGFASGGTRLDAEVGTALLETVFYPGSPLHDGAVLIFSGRLMFAGCHLPSSESPNIPRVLGTRHRAAIGMSEESDALVIVVSEETGRISIARRGELERDISPSALRDLIHEGIVTQLEVPAQEKEEPAEERESLPPAPPEPETTEQPVVEPEEISR